MLTKGDDYPIHQTPEPIAYSGTDRNFYDRYFFNGYSQDGELFFAMALGVYPHLNVMDASFCVVYDGIQHNLHASRILPMERLDTQVGPIGLEVLEPLQCLRIFCEPTNATSQNIKAELRFDRRCSPVEEPRFTRRVGSRLMMDVTRMTQNGCFQGSLELKGKTFNIQPDRFLGTRDRSWGIRPVGERDNQPNPYAEEPQFYWLWAPLNFADYCTFYHLNSDAAGVPWNTSALMIDSESDSSIAMLESHSRLDFVSGTRHARNAHIHMTDSKHQGYDIELRPIYNFYMKGLGYGHPTWAHGRYHGSLETEYEEYDMKREKPSAPENLHVQALCKATLSGPGIERQGIGVLEQLIFGKHQPSGFTDILDLAP